MKRDKGQGTREKGKTMLGKEIRFSLSLVTCALCLGYGGAVAQPYPSKAVRFIVPQTAGSATDTVARGIAVKLAERLGHPVVAENRPGASGLIGGEVVAKAPPDGHTILIVSATHSVNPSLRRNMPFDPVKDFAPVTLATSQPYVLLAHPSLPARSVRELVALAKARPGQIDYAATAVGSLGHLGFELLNVTAGIKLNFIPYKGVSPALTDLLGGHVSVLFLTVVSSLPQVRAGRLRGLAVSGAKRVAVAPEIPTVAENGFPGFEVSGWYGILAPAGTPAAIVTRLNGEIVAILRSPELKERLAADGSEAVGSTPQQFADHLRAEIAKWGKVAKAAQIQPE
jgi:tripartite-type tricarboxylate transporter receptor subunit TctC